MKRFYGAIAMLSLIVLCSVFTLLQCRNFHSTAVAQLTQMMESAENDRPQQAAVLAEQFYESWQETKDSMVWYIRHEPLERITDISSHLEYLAKYNDLSQLLAQANQLMTCIDELYHDELPLLRNLV